MAALPMVCAQSLGVYRNDAGEVNVVSYHGESEWLAAQKDPKSHLHKLPALEAVTLNNFVVSRPVMRYVAKLKAPAVLEVGILPEGVVVEDGGLEELRNATGLEELGLSVAGLRDADLAFLPALEKLAVLRLGIGSSRGHGLPMLTDGAAQHLAKLKALEVLEIGWVNEKFTDAFVERLASLPKLESLSIYEAKELTDAVFPIIAKKMNLRTLKVDSPHFTDAGVAALLEAKTLESLHIECSGLTAAAIEALAGHPRLSYIEFVVGNGRTTLFRRESKE